MSVDAALVTLNFVLKRNFNGFLNMNNGLKIAVKNQ